LGLAFGILKISCKFRLRNLKYKNLYETFNKDSDDELNTEDNKEFSFSTKKLTKLLRIRYLINVWKHPGRFI
jgi:hypothetical protein